MSQKRRGFTLIEILVVIAIIGLLSTVVFAAMSQARSNARDKDRLAQLKQLQTAIEIYGHTTGQYPETGCGRGLDQWTGHGSIYGSCAVYIDGITDLMSPLPVDPIVNNYGYIYRTNAERTEYKLMIFNALEGVTVTAASEYARYREGDGCPGGMSGNNSRSYAVYSGTSAKCW